MSLQTERQRTRTLREIVAEDQARSSRRIERRQLARKIIVLPTPKAAPAALAGNEDGLRALEGHGWTAAG